MAGRQHRGTEIARGFEKIAKLDRLIAFHAWHRRLAGDIARGETIDHCSFEAIFVIENVMRNADAFGHGTGIVDIAPGAAGTLTMGRGAMVVELQRNEDDV